ncbi:LacI family transcriptional regulator [Microbacterium keratanolyticum]|uniref:LacI family transcriptional regulator n=2 Tax=Microbacterium keratanolyticum TaxID=67574 RepID=A0A9W6HRP5_9MICO|nr:LacI family transcriptional regulator [Microbacterium keratanolyticum]
MKDVAAHAGVGLSTVSRVVAGSPGVSLEKTQAVEDAIAALGFRRNDFARTLRTGATHTIGVVVTRISDPFYATLIGAIERRAQEHQMLVLVASGTDDPDEGVRVLQRVLSRQLDGLILVAHEDADYGFLAQEQRAGAPFVFVDRPPRGVDADLVMVDNENGAAAAVAHLVAAGHQRIACIAHVSGRFTSERRQAGYRAGLRAAGLPVDPALIVEVEDDVDACATALRALFAADAPPTALFTTNSRTTTAVLQALRALGEAPALVGFDDFALANLMTPPTTTVAQDPTAIGEAAVDLLFERIAGAAGQPRRIELGTRIIPRGSGEIAPR